VGIAADALPGGAVALRQVEHVAVEVAQAVRDFMKFTAAALDQLAELLASRVATGGVIALSGILHGQEGELLARYAPWFEQLEATQLGDWMRITGRRVD